MNIAVLGAGVSGLASGIRLRERGHAVTMFAERVGRETTSARAPAYFTPFHLPESTRFRAWTARSHAVFVELARDPETGVSMGTVREFGIEPGQAAPWWSAYVQGFRALVSVPPPYVRGFEMRLPRMEMGRYLPWLERRFERDLGGTIMQARILDIEEPFDEGFDLVVNCTGLGARRLAHDDQVFPVRGQLLHVPNEMHLDAAVCDEGDGPLSTYVFPFRDHIVIGGTCEPDEWIEECDETALDAMLARARELLRVSGNAAYERLGRRRLRAIAGLRPGRRSGADEEAVRVEREELAHGRVVVHDYGHGRAGVTLSWGCAEEVVRLCEAEALRGGTSGAARTEHERKSGPGARASSA